MLQNAFDAGARSAPDSTGTGYNVPRPFNWN